MGLHKGIDKYSRMRPDAAIPDGWKFRYPNTADFNFNYWRLLADAGGSSIGKNNNPALKIAIIGGGIAGLTAMRELFRSGYTIIDLYEATDRLGGRLYSVPVDGQYTTFEMGAMRMPFFSSPGCRNSVLDYYRERFKITVQPFPDPGSMVADTGIYLNGGLGPAPTTAPLPEPQLLIWERNNRYPPTGALRNVFEKWGRFASLFRDEARTHYGTEGWESFWQSVVSHYWDRSFRDLVYMDRIEQYDPACPGYFGGLGMDETEARLFYTIGAGDGAWGAFYDISCLFPIRTLLFGYGTNHQLVQGCFNETGLFKGGPHCGSTLQDSLGNPFQGPNYLGVQTFADSMFFQPVASDNVANISLYDGMLADQYGINLYTRNPVERVKHRPDGRLELVSRHLIRTYDIVILSPTTWATQMMIDFEGFDGRSQWPFEVQHSFKMSHWIRSCKVFYPLRERYWGEGKPIPQLISTDTCLQGVYGYALDTQVHHDPGVLLLSYTWEDDANKFLAEADDRVLAEKLLDRLDRLLLNCTNVRTPISPYVNHLRPVVIHWAKQPAYRGCARLYRARSWNEDYALLRYNQCYSAQSKIYFAGEAFSVEGGWTEPALRGALDAVIHIIKHTGGTFLNRFDYDRDYPQHSAWHPETTCDSLLTPIP